MRRLERQRLSRASWIVHIRNTLTSILLATGAAAVVTTLCRFRSLAGSREAGLCLPPILMRRLLSNTDTLTSWLENGSTGGVGQVQDWNNLAGERSLSSQDVSQRLVLSYVLDLPFGHGKRFLGNVSGFTSKVVSGWGVDGVTTFQRGFPLKIAFGGGND